MRKVYKYLNIIQFMIQTIEQEIKPSFECNARKLELARQLLDFLNAHVMSDEGVLKTSFKQRARN